MGTREQEIKKNKNPKSKLIQLQKPYHYLVTMQTSEEMNRNEKKKTFATFFMPVAFEKERF